MIEEQRFSWNLPAGFTARPSTLADVAEATEVFNTASLKFTGQPEFSLEQTQTFWQSSGFDLAQHSRAVIAPDGRLVANVDVDMTSAMPVHIVIWARVHPQFAGLGIGTAMMQWAEYSARKAIPRVPTDARVVLYTDVYGTDDTAVQLMIDCGFTHVRDFWRMKIEFDEAFAGEPPLPVWPEGIRLSNMAERPDLTAIVAVKEEAFRDHWGHVEEPLELAVADTRNWLENDPTHQPANWLLAMDGDEIAGMCWCRLNEYSDPEMGWVSTLAVRRPYRGRGLGMALLQESFRLFYRHGFKRAGLHVDAGSLTHATRLYEKAGMKIQRRKLVFEKELQAGRDLTTSSALQP